MDLDQGSVFAVQEWVNVYLGPSIGWVRRPLLNRINILTGGTTNIDLAVNLVTVQFNGSVTLVLPNTSIALSGGNQAGQAVQPGITAITSITIVDVGGFAQANPITIQPFGTGKIMNLNSIAISVNYGGFTLLPSKSQANFWSSVSP